MVENINLRIKEFEKFYYFLMKSTPKDYIPWFFPCKPNGKDPSPEAILKIDSQSKGSWHHESARLTKEQCIEHIKKGYNVGLSARKGDPLIIVDIDDSEFLYQTIKDTLTVTSRKRAGTHSFCWDKDGTAKINLPIDSGEIRSDNQYVLACGSYVPFNLNNEKEKKTYDKLPKEAREDKQIGYYTVRENVSPKEITFNEIPEIFKEKQLENIEVEAKIKNREFDTKGKYSELFKLKVSDIVGLIPANKRQGHPLHESDTDANFSLSKDGSIAHCWRHLVSLNVVQYLCVQAKYKSCVDCGTPHKGRGISKIKGDKKAYKIAYEEAIKLGLIKEIDSITEASKIFTLEFQAEVFNKIQPIFYDKAGLFWLWDNNLKKWEIVDDVDILNMIYKSTGKDVITSKARTETLNALKQMGRLNIPKPIKKTWIQFKDMIYDLDSGDKFEATPEYFVTNPIPHKISGDPRTPKIDEIFEEWVGKKYVRTLK